MPEQGPDRLVARDACKLEVGFLGRRGFLSLYADRVLFSMAGGVKGHDLTLDRVEWVELRGRNRQQLAVGFEGGESVFKLPNAATRFTDLCALLVQLHPTPPWLDARYGPPDSVAVANFLAPYGESLQGPERLDLCEWAIAWTEDAHVRCGWLCLTSRRILFLPVASGPKRSPNRCWQPKLIERVEGPDLPVGQLCFLAGGAFERFDTYGGASFQRSFWSLCDAPLYSPEESHVRRGQSLRRLEGEVPLLRLVRNGGNDLVFENALLEPRGQHLKIRFRVQQMPELERGEACFVEVVKPAGLFRLEARVLEAEPIEDGPFKATWAQLVLEPLGDIRFVNRRRAFRVEVNIPIHVRIESRLPGGGWSEPVSTLFRIADLSNIGCALVGPRSIDPSARFSFDLPLGPEGEDVTIQAECVHVMELPGTTQSRQYGCHLVGLNQRQRDQIQQEVIRQERLQLQRRSRIKR